MWKMLERAFLARSPRLYMMTPHATEQYGQVLRVSVARASLNSRTSAIAAVGEKPRSARLDPARETPVILKNSRRVTSAMANLSGMSADRGEFIPLQNVRGCLSHCGRAGGRLPRKLPPAPLRSV